METTTQTSVPAVIDVEALLAPIPGDKPSGEETRYSGLYDEVREARRAEDTLEQGDWKREPKVADWPHVKRSTLDALENRTKDLQICAWLTEALARLDGFPGLRDGLKVMNGLHERFWESVYPEIEGDDLEGRANTLSGFDRAVAEALKSVAITGAPGLADVSYLQFEDSKQFDIPENLDSLDSDTIERANALKARAQKEGRTTSEDWRKAKAASRRAFYEETHLLLNECWAEYLALDRVMDEKFGRQTPGLGELKKSLDAVRSLVEKTLKEKRVLEPDAVVVMEESVGELSGANGEPSLSVSTGNMASSLSGPVRSRQEALRRLREVADFFRQTEPHSPVSYLVQRAVKWGEMPLDTWLAEVIKDDNVLSSLRETLGLSNSHGESDAS
ncbi:MAG: type VI secretion system protein TssA [Pyrinomonadaceae bacterium]